MKNNAEIGRYGENLALKFLKYRNCEILESNFRTKSSEIDIIMRDGEYVVFVEVKYRKNTTKGNPCEAVTSRKQNAIIEAANHYICENQLSNIDFRFDVIEIIDIDKLEINHIKNAFTL